MLQAISYFQYIVPSSFTPKFCRVLDKYFSTRKFHVTIFLSKVRCYQLASFTSIQVDLFPSSFAYLTIFLFSYPLFLPCLSFYSSSLFQTLKHDILENKGGRECSLFLHQWNKNNPSINKSNISPFCNHFAR